MEEQDDVRIIGDDVYILLKPPSGDVVWIKPWNMCSVIVAQSYPNDSSCIVSLDNGEVYETVHTLDELSNLVSRGKSLACEKYKEDGDN